MKKSIRELLEDRKAEVAFRTDRTQATFGPRQLSESPVAFEVSEKTRAVSHGGLALIHQIALRSGLCNAINAVPVLKLKMPYHESDHVLNIAYNFLCGGQREGVASRQPSASDGSRVVASLAFFRFVVYELTPAPNGSGLLATSGSSSGVQRPAAAGGGFLQAILGGTN